MPEVLFAVLVLITWVSLGISRYWSSWPATADAAATGISSGPLLGRYCFLSRPSSALPGASPAAACLGAGV